MSSLSQIAEQVYGRVSEFRRVLDMNPQELPFQLPPQVEAGIDRATSVLRLPSLSELRERALDEANEGLAVLRSRLGDALDAVEATEDDVAAVLQKIDWLL